MFGVLQIKNWKSIHDFGNGSAEGKMRQSPALTYFRSRDIITDLMRLKINIPDDKRTPGRTLETDKFIRAWRILQEEQEKQAFKLTNAVGRCPDPLISHLHPES